MIEATNTEHLMTLAEAVKFLKRAKTRNFSAMVFPELPIPDRPGKCLGGCASIKLTRPSAIALAQDLLSPTLEGRGARIKITEYRSGDYCCIYVG